MKNIIFSLFILTAFSISGQTLTMDRVPKDVQHAFHAKYPGAQQESWQQAGANVFQVGFFSAKKALTARFDNTGKWLATETDITGGQIPRPVSNAIAKNFPGFDLQIVSQIESPDGTMTYEAVLFKGKENYDVTFSAKGEILKKEAGQPNE